MTQAVIARHLAWHACYNTRDLGGYKTASQAETRWNRIIRSDSLHRLTENGHHALAQHGVSTIIDLRSPQEVAAAPFVATQDPFACPVYLHIPIIENGFSLATEILNSLQDMSELYRLMLESCGGRFAAVIRAIVDAEPGAVVFYCHAGKDRTGLVAAMLLALAGVSQETIAEDYALSDHYLQPLYEEIRTLAARGGIHTPVADWLLQTRAETMMAVMSFLENHDGGVEAYLDHHGVTGDKIQQVQERLLI